MSWNINGSTSVKLASPEFCSFFSQFDVIFLQEMHLCPEQHAALPIPHGFLLEALSRKPHPTGANSGGGVLVLVRTAIPYQVCHALCTPDIIVLQIGGTYLVNAYILPEHSPMSRWTDVPPFDAFCNLMTLLPPEVPLVVMGDLNARIVNLSTHDDFPRHSLDSEMVTPRGRKLVELCRQLHYVILNGTHLEAAQVGQPTSLQFNVQAP